MINTDHYIRFERVDSVTETGYGLLAELHREQLKIDIVSHDVLRIKISRGGVFDESPTFAVCVDPLASPAPIHVDTGRRTGAVDHRVDDRHRSGWTHSGSTCTAATVRR